MTFAIFHDFPGLKMVFLNSMTFHDQRHPATNAQPTVSVKNDPDQHTSLILLVSKIENVKTDSFRNTKKENCYTHRNRKLGATEQVNNSPDWHNEYQSL